MSRLTSLSHQLPWGLVLRRGFDEATHEHSPLSMFLQTTLLRKASTALVKRFDLIC